MKEVNEMTYYELISLEAWCTKRMKDCGRSYSNYYLTLRNKAAERINEIIINEYLEKFWAEKENNKQGE